MTKIDTDITKMAGLSETRETLPTHYYIDAEHYERELKSIWYRQWVYVGRNEDWDGPQRYKLFKLGNQSIIVLRDRDGVLRAFHNTCRHRGSALITEPEGRLGAGGIVCPYHAWSYDLDGTLKKVSSERTPPDFRFDDHGLYDVAIENWRGFVFINLAGKSAAPLAASFDQDASILNNWPLEKLRVGHRMTKTIKCNWKVFWENFNECLHCPNVHPELVKLVPVYKSRWMSADDRPGLPAGLRPGAQSWTETGEACDAPFTDLTAEELDAGQKFLISLPSIFIVAHIDYVRIVRLLPLTPETVELQSEWLFRSDSLSTDSIDIAKVTAFAARVIDQDSFVAELNQRGLHAIAHRQGTLMPEDYAVLEFQDWIRDRLADDGA